MRRLAAAAATLLIAVAAVLGGAGDARAQDAPDPPPGSISGTVTMGTAGESLDDGTTVQVVVLADSQLAGTLDAPVEHGRYEVEASADPALAYVPIVEHGGVQYFGPAVRLSADAPEGTSDVTVYATTSELPPLTITETVLTVVGIDRGTGELALFRDDLVVNPTDRVYVGDAGGVTLRLPAPEDTQEATGDNIDGDFTLQEGLLTTTVPIRPEGQTAVVTRYLVTYDPAADEYTLRVTAPLPTGRTTLRIPFEYARELGFDSPAREEAQEVLESGGTAVVVRTVVLDNLDAGDSLVVTLSGMAPETNENALTEGNGARIAAVIALGLVGGGVWVAVARRRAHQR